ncbi:MAG: class A beta-lactamase-related serine hydrolase [Spirochaetaceae bacterium]|nr:MAG: class A beta-lactamase-related serine hydrolase [Spirochaetaceae bacterium]
MMAMTLKHSSPEAQGVPSGQIESFIRALSRVPQLHGLVVVRHGAVIADAAWRPYRRDVPHMLYSLSKSFASTAVGLAVHEGLLSVDDRVLDHFPDDAPKKPSAHLEAMRVRHLLSMSTGHAEDATEATMRSRTQPYRAFLRIPVVHEPGTHFVYNSAATFMLAAIVQRLTGQTLVDYLTPRLFEPLGIESPVWESHPNGVNFGGWGLYLRAMDIAKFGQLYLQRGKWGRSQLIPRDWITEATRTQVDNGSDPRSDWNQGYGYQFWRCRHNCYRGDGAFGQYCIVMPDQDAVVAITSGVASMQAVLDVVWKKLLPAFGSAPLPADTVAEQKAQKLIDGLAAKPVSGTVRAAIEEEVTGRTYTFEPNHAKLHSISLDFANSTFTYRLLSGGAGRGRRSIGFGRNRWVEGTSVLGRPCEYPAAASGAWTSERRFELSICQLDTPHTLTFGFTFDGDTVRVDQSVNVSFGPKETQTLTGQAALR